jgi:signal transduction histidine kinase
MHIFRLPRRSVRLRLTLLYGGLFLVSGAGLLAITNALTARTLPTLVTTSRGASGPSAGISTGGAPGAGTGTGPGQLCIQASGGQSLAISPDPSCVSYLRNQAAQLHSADLHQLVIESGIALAIMAVISIGLGWLVAGRVLRPLRTITAAARHISATNLHERLALDGPDDDLKELADTFDGLLSRLDTAFSAQRQFIANASHELRTPLARERTLVEVALRDPQATVGSLQATCARVLAAGEQQERLIEALLTLARGQRGIDQRTPLDLGTITEGVLTARKAEIERCGLRIDAALSGAALSGDPPLVERLVANLVDNALRHNVAQGRVEIMTGTRAGRAIIRVANTGQAIPPDEAGRLVQPFQRLGADRTAHREGLGLGLSIVHAIAAAHDATLSLWTPSYGGVIAEVSFPGPAGGPRIGEPRNGGLPRNDVIVGSALRT